MKKTNNTVRRQSSLIIKQLLDEITPLERSQTLTRMTLAARLFDLITVKGWSKSEFAKKVNKRPSEITKWLSGTQNFTIDILTEISQALNIPVCELLAPKQVQIVNKFHVVIAVNEIPVVKYVTPLLMGIHHNDDNYNKNHYSSVDKHFLISSLKN